MNVPAISHIALALVAGALIGVFYFAGLWWTIRQLPGRARPGLWLLGSYVVRGGGALCGFYLVMGENGIRLLTALAGFFVVRTLFVRKLRPVGEQAPTAGARGPGRAGDRVHVRGVK